MLRHEGRLFSNILGLCGTCGVTPQHVEMYRKRKRTKTDTSVDTEKIK
jgi:hypothetical protein